MVACERDSESRQGPRAYKQSTAGVPTGRETAKRWTVGPTRTQRPADGALPTPPSAGRVGRGPHAPERPTLRAGPRPGTLQLGEEAPRAGEDGGPTLGPTGGSVRVTSPASPYIGTPGPAAAT